MHTRGNENGWKMIRLSGAKCSRAVISQGMPALPSVAIRMCRLFFFIQLDLSVFQGGIAWYSRALFRRCCNCVPVTISGFETTLLLLNPLHGLTGVAHRGNFTPHWPYACSAKCPIPPPPPPPSPPPFLPFYHPPPTFTCRPHGDAPPVRFCDSLVPFLNIKPPPVRP